MTYLVDIWRSHDIKSIMENVFPFGLDFGFTPVEHSPFLIQFLDEDTGYSTRGGCLKAAKELFGDVYPDEPIKFFWTAGRACLFFRTVEDRTLFEITYPLNADRIDP